MAGDPEFVSLGMLVLDELRFSSKETLFDVPGGSGLYATLGSRLIAGSPNSAATACVILAGNDFPDKALQELQSWNMRLLVHKSLDQPSTRGLLEYEDDAFGKKKFRYLTTPLQPTPKQLADSNLLRSKSFHVLATPEALSSQIASLLELRKKADIPERPLIVWEPSPLGCDVANLAAHLDASRLVDVFSPNHLELQYLMEGKYNAELEFSKQRVESLAQKFLANGIGPSGQGFAMIRCGEHGVLILTRKSVEWLPSFYDQPSAKVIDPTGGGNTFLGGFTTMFSRTGDIKEAVIWGSVAASYAIEQIGLPKLRQATDHTEETWNESNVGIRVEEFKARLTKKKPRADSS